MTRHAYRPPHRREVVVTAALCALFLVALAGALSVGWLLAWRWSR